MHPHHKEKKRERIPLMRAVNITRASMGGYRLLMSIQEF